jgi:hypothetical protein
MLPKNKPIRVTSKAAYQKLVQTVFELDNYKCQDPYSTDMKRRAIEPHHLISRARGGADTVENMISVARNSHRRFHEGVRLETMPQAFRKSIRKYLPAPEAEVDWISGDLYALAVLKEKKRIHPEKFRHEEALRYLANRVLKNNQFGRGGAEEKA